MNKKHKNIKQKNLKTPWLLREKYPRDLIKKNLSGLSLKIRNEQFEIFKKLMKIKATDKVLDVGVSSVETLEEINFFEKSYSYPENLTAASIDEPLDFPKKYPKIKYVQIDEGKKLPFNDKSFDIVASWATLEHVGSEGQQKFFLEELFRVGKKVFVTTPDRASIYDPHSELFILHWLPRPMFRSICRLLKKNFWADEKNFRCLFKEEANKLVPKKSKAKIIPYRLLGFLPSHLVIVKI